MALDSQDETTMSQVGRLPITSGAHRRGITVRTNTADWSDSRKRSRFTSGGAAVSAIPLREMRRLLDELHASAEFQLAAPDVTQGPHALAGSGLPSGAWERVRERLNEVEAAQERIADGSYGTCFGCGRPIPVPRLRALPCCRYCRSCDRQVRRGSPHPVTDISDTGHRPAT
jgi:RNA polymerase-binding transcription factor